MNKLLQKIVYATMFFMTLGMTSAYAIPSFARQTGFECTQCHTVFPELTATGRWFKLNGYTMSNNDKMSPVDNLAGMIMVGYTKNADTTTGAAPDSTKDKKLSLDQASIFYGGKIADNLGAFVQVTFDGTSLIGSGKTNDVAHHIVADNVDFRYVRDFKIGEDSLLIGATLNNNPSMQDIYNTTPTWTFPYSSSSNMNTPVAATMVDGGLSQKVAGVGIYAMYNDLVYAEVSGYQSNRSGGLLHALRYNPTYADTNELHGTAIYTRLAVQKTAGDNFFMVGGYTMDSKMDPDVTAANTTFDNYADRAIDAQYNYTNGSHIVTAMATKIWEKMKLNNTNPGATDTLSTTRAKLSYYYDQKYGVTAGVFSTSGTTDSAQYGFQSDGTTPVSPNSSGKIVELDYLPMQKVKITLQYTMYDKFNGAKDNYDGSGRNAKDNDNLFLSAWMMF